MITFLTEAAPAGAENPQFFLFFMVIMLVMVIVMQFFSRNKEKKEAKLLLDNLEVGDKIMTTAGIIGLVTDLRGNEFIIETGNSRTSILLTKQALYRNMSAEERLAKAKKDKKAGKSTKSDKESTKKVDKVLEKEKDEKKAKEEKDEK